MASISNPGYWGINVTEGEKYVVTLFARSKSINTIVVQLSDTNASAVYAAQTITGIGQDWTQYTAELTAVDSDPSAIFSILFSPAFEGHIAQQMTH